MTGLARLDYEFGRATRYERPLSILAVEGGEDLLLSLAKYLRQADVVVTLEDQIIVLLPETAVVGAQTLRERLAEAFPGTLFRVASFPEDGAALDTLMAAAR